MWTKAQETSYRHRALRMLEAREHSLWELKHKLITRECPEPLADFLCEELKRYGYQSDERFVDSFVRTKIRAGWGRLRIIRELGQRGVRGGELEASLEGLEDMLGAQGEYLRAKEIAQRRLALGQDKEKLFRFLCQRGFDSGCVRTALMDAQNEIAMS